MQIKIINQLTMNSGTIVNDVISDRENYRCWIEITAFLVSNFKQSDSGMSKYIDKTRIPQNAKHVFRILKHYVSSDVTENTMDYGEDDHIVDKFLICYTFEEMMEWLRENNVDDNNFTEPWNSDYPL